jgi:hypothetical protein
MTKRRWIQIAGPAAGAAVGYLYSMWSISHGST